MDTVSCFMIFIGIIFLGYIIVQLSIIIDYLKILNYPTRGGIKQTNEQLNEIAKLVLNHSQLTIDCHKDVIGLHQKEANVIGNLTKISQQLADKITPK